MQLGTAPLALGLGSISCWLLAGGILLAGCLQEADSTERPVEVGQVAWSNDLEQALGKSADTGKPVLVLFQEIPGCQTCQSFGSGPLSHPLLVEAMETEFHPVLVHNNRPGRDAAILKRFGEPSWNNPVIRYLDFRGEDVIARKDGVWSADETAARMVAALEVAEREVPTYLLTVRDDPSLRKTRQASFAMHCYWEGEVRLGQVPGVVGTRSRWIGNHEVVTVDYLPEVVAYGDLVDSAGKIQCASQVYAADADEFEIARAKVGDRAVLQDFGQQALATRDAKMSDQKYYLAQTDYLHLPLSEPQAVQINAALALRQDADRWLSPRQQELLKQISAASPAQREQLRGVRYSRQAKDMAVHQQRLRELLEDR